MNGTLQIVHDMVWGSILTKDPTFAIETSWKDFPMPFQSTLTFAMKISGGVFNSPKDQRKNFHNFSPSI
jgi:hypothetical protein